MSLYEHVVQSSRYRPRANAVRYPTAPGDLHSMWIWITDQDGDGTPPSPPIPCAPGHILESNETRYRPHLGPHAVEPTLIEALENGGAYEHVHCRHHRSRYRQEVRSVGPESEVPKGKGEVEF